VILTGYGSGLVEGFSADAKMIINTQQFRNVFRVGLNKGKNNVQEWRMQGCFGKVTASGLGGSITGKGAALAIIDDYFKSREEAESETMRDKVWMQITNDVMSRLAPVSITLVVATPWHVDGPGKRILKAMEDDPDFPRFRHLRFPARRPIGTDADGKAKYEYLFPERYSEKWYRSQYATLGPYASRGLLDCDPVPASGNACKREWFTIVDTLPAGMRVMRGWDLAATAKKSADFCCGFLLGKAPNGRLYFIDDFRTQSPAASIKTIIMNTAMQDIERFGRDNYGVIIEQEPGSTGIIVADDFITSLRHKNIRAFRGLTQGDKLTRALPLFAYCAANFDQGEQYCTGLLRAKWNSSLLDTMTAFPEVKNDDEVDGAAHAFNGLNKPSAGVI
jgi:predicted phage terminase large subunit-like protein